MYGSKITVLFLDIIKEERNNSARSPVLFGYVNSPRLMKEERMKKVAIYHYQYGRIVCRDVAEDRAILASLNRAKSSEGLEHDVPRPVKRAFVEFKCPSSTCDAAQQCAWSCEICRQQMEYGFDSYFYCTCGRAPRNTFSYKCNGANHGDEFVQFDSENLQQFTASLNPITYLNILLLGETGVGKSTWINGFANYLSFDTLEEAEKNDSICLIPSQFTMTDENYQERTVSTGTDSNEDYAAGQSATQMPTSYVFKRGKRHVRLIDTPGIGDTRGIEQDRENMQNIMAYLANLEEINGIFILLKPNNARLTVMFSFCIKELLTHLHRNACQNIVFCFTNARGTFYHPGDTLPALRNLLSKNPNVTISLTTSTIYCFDNEAIRFLAALKHGIQFDDVQRKDYATSWETSVTETNRLINHVSSLPPHKVKNTLSLNEARRRTIDLSRPLAEISATITTNINLMNEKKRCESNRDYLTAKKLNVKIKSLEARKLGYPRTVCGESACKEEVTVDGKKMTKHKIICHDHCSISAESNKYHCEALQHCAAMGGRDNTCTHCSHPWYSHMYITYELYEVEKTVVEDQVNQQIDSKKSDIEKIKEKQQTLQQEVDQQQNEQDLVMQASAEFAYFLKSNAIAPYNDALADYLDHLIKDEQGKVAVDKVRNRGCLQKLEDMKGMYEALKKTLDEAIKNPTAKSKPPTPEDIDKWYMKLCELKRNGEQLRQIMVVVQSANASAHAYSEKLVSARVKPPTSRQKRHGTLTQVWHEFKSRIWKP